MQSYLKKKDQRNQQMLLEMEQLKILKAKKFRLQPIKQKQTRTKLHQRISQHQQYQLQQIRQEDQRTQLRQRICQHQQFQPQQIQQYQQKIRQHLQSLHQEIEEEI